jgi:S-adenosylmethionine synthetase
MMGLLVEELQQQPVASHRFEVVERKGLGHPDSLCDALVEAVSVELNTMYRQRIGTIPHYNIDKALLAAGQCEKGFGSGRVVKPMQLIVGDRATFEAGGQALPVVETVRHGVARWVNANLPHVRFGRDLQVRDVLAAGSEELRGIFAEAQVPVASNDTSAACGYAPLSPTEKLVLAVERHLNAAEFKSEFPDTGQDVKVLAQREDDRVAVTVAMPFLCSAINSENSYFQRKEAVLAELAEHFAAQPFEITWRLNSLDRHGSGVAGVYLSVTGTSAEDADSGQVGRGNRVNGLIPLSRPAGREAAAGKNPVAHVGKIYNVLSQRLADLIQGRCPQLQEVYVYLAARIGERVDRPWTAVQVVLPAGLDFGDVRNQVAEVVGGELDRMPEFREELIRGAYPVC